ncbi:MAG: discoidin domain-containing protein, partial [Myxococcaceae bacterium]|nr:discoidin domain-containing protein [Myxococcaceae bacterium]
AGGSAAGGSAAGGSAAGGSAAGGSAAGGSAAGGSAAGGSAAGGSAAGGSAAGGSAAGGSAAGGSAAGGSAAGGSAAGGSAAGGSAAGGAAAGGSAAGGSAAGGSAAGGSAAGGSAAGGSAGGASSLCVPGAYDAGVPGGELFADGGFTATGTRVSPDGGVSVTATSTWSGYPATNVLDFDLDTSWYIDSLCTATSGLYCCEPQSVQVTLPTAATVRAVVLRGNAGAYPDGYDFLTARLELISSNGGVVATRNVVFNRPAGDWAVTFSPAVANVRVIRLRPGWAEDTASGLSEVQVYVQ